ncbi:MAG TPA: hypothetical protein PKO41_04310 [Dokdonella sp.]|uniref:hypothetical protein n=1 Tax=Dokdonella sp. TaxID=2291710 RepID=UPI0025C48D80|nr:hypothetical protein [Dokdonella sp.]MBX3691654.1 hypothetical protein [Dokdonella sp.]MCW5567387.1 hypothetical protein [Dokdonella sp.]HNR91632.1 hypothetical protein [Dokdonella sp.]
MAGDSSVYAIEEGDVARDRETVLDVWRGNLGDDARMRAKYDWFYVQCPFGEPLLRLLRFDVDKCVVGAATAGPRRMIDGERGIEAGVLVDLAVRGEHRSLGPALMLQSALVAAGGRRFDLLYGFPNPKAAPVFKRVGYEQLAEMVRHARVLRHAGYLQRRLPPILAVPFGRMLDGIDALKAWLRRREDARTRWHWSECTDPRFDLLWARSPHQHSITTVRDAAFARWRFDACPFAETRFLIVEDDNGGLVAWFACQSGDGLLHVRDFWSEHGTAGVSRAHVDVLVHAARRAGHAALSVEFSGSSAAFSGWSTCGFVERSRRPVYGRWSADAATRERSLHLTSADEDE